MFKVNEVKRKGKRHRTKSGIAAKRMELKAQSGKQEIAKEVTPVFTLLSGAGEPRCDLRNLSQIEKEIHL